MSPRLLTWQAKLQAEHERLKKERQADEAELRAEVRREAQEARKETQARSVAPFFPFSFLVKKTVFLSFFLVAAPVKTVFLLFFGGVAAPVKRGVFPKK